MEVKSFMTFSDMLRNLREQKGYTQKDLSETLHISPTAISHYENGSREPDVGVLIKIAECLDVSVDYLIGFTSCNIPYSKLTKQYIKGITTKELLYRLEKLDNEHKQLLVSLIGCFESDMLFSSKRKQ